MRVYRNHYGASVDRGIGIQAQSAELKQLNLDGILKELSSMHALESSEHDKEMLSYLVEKGEYSILGVSYTEQPKASGYNRSAPCGLQYVVHMDELAEVSAELGSIINFVSFQKPDSSTPAPLNNFPRNESGYTYHNSPSVIAPIVDSLVRVALSGGNDLLIIALPKGKNSEYATARYTMAELLCYLPVSLRTNVRFFTGLPVQEGKNDPIEGLDNAIRFGANVVFCPNEYFRTLTSHRNCYGVDMDQPAGNVGAFAEYVSKATDLSNALTMVQIGLGNSLTYNSLNQAAEKAQSGEVSIEQMQRRLAETQKAYGALERQFADANNRCMRVQQDYDKLRMNYDGLNQKYNTARQEYSRLKQDYNQLSQQNNSLNRTLNARPARQNQVQTYNYGNAVAEEGPSVLKIVINVAVAIVMMFAAILMYNGVVRGWSFGQLFDFSRVTQQEAVKVPESEKETEATETENGQAQQVFPEGQNTPIPDGKTDEKPTEESSATLTVEPIQTPTDEPETIPAEENTDSVITQSDEEKAEEPVILYDESKTAKVKATKAHIREKPAINSKNPVDVHQNDKLTVTGEVKVDDGYTWYKVKTETNIEGFIREDLITILK